MDLAACWMKVMKKHEFPVPAMVYCSHFCSHHAIQRDNLGITG